MTADVPDDDIDVHAFMTRALDIVRTSSEPVAQVGCIAVARDNVVIGTAVNGIPRRLRTTVASRSGSPLYAWVEHAERRVIYDVLGRGVSLAGSTLYVTWFPCIDCARAIVQVDVTTLVTSPPDFRDVVWGENWRWADALLRASGVTLRLYDFPV